MTSPASFVRALALTGALAASACARPPEPGPLRPVAPDVEIRSLAPGVWMHTTWKTMDGVRFPTQGLAVEDGDGLLLVDPAWGEDETRALVAWLEGELGRRVTTMLSTHHHEDRVSGVAFLRGRGARVLSHPLTPALAAANGYAPPNPLSALGEVGSAVRLGPVEVFYPGAGHAVDNLVVWLPGSRILYGGCLVRPGDSGSLGNVADADLESWPRAIRRVRQRYGDARLVIPGHGAPGGAPILGHTLELLEHSAGPGR